MHGLLVFADVWDDVVETQVYRVTYVVLSPFLYVSQIVEVFWQVERWEDEDVIWVVVWHGVDV